MNILGVAVVGLGVGEQHARAFLRTGQCSLRWLYDLSADRMTTVIAALGSGSGAESYEAILADKSVDIVSIASYDDAHYRQILSALQKRKHVFVEKPLCRSLEELRRIKKQWLETDCQLTSNLVLRAAPLYIWLKQAIQAGELGEVYACDGDYLYGRIQKITEGWRNRVDNYSVMQGGGIHLVDLMLTLTGQKPNRVSAVGNRICTTATPFHYNDFMAATFQFPSGLVGRITANFGCVHRHQHVLRIFGTKGTFIYDDQGPRLLRSRDSSTKATPIGLAPLPATKGDLIPSFVNSIVQGENPRSKGQHEFDVVSACVTADLASAKNALIEIEYI